MIISIHSLRGGTGKSNTTANVAALMAQRGYRVGVIDTDIQSPGIHVLFRMDDNQFSIRLMTISGKNAQFSRPPMM
ncbi:MAG: P-loop NTPase [Caldilineaceae bacterium]